MLKRYVLIPLLFLLAGCGFKLRGSFDIPSWFNNVALINQGAQPDLHLQLKDQLQSYGIRVLPNAKGSSFMLILEKDSIQEQITSVGASTTPRQYQLIYTVHYSLVKTNGEPLMSSNQVSVTRQLTVNNNRILGSNAEETLIYSEMRRDAAMQIMNRINHKLN
ncbi:rare lipoprotein B [Legionella birminghamensis]|uniref:LPS-assembly lipoprotein LptE n=1 Tax=Legionella birminghamensis TaxID=28083 RepID=A0A378I9U2_9GAMM|nr:LPS assembly lipoprotein LptE [Legionella birminghamensis]KTC75246.1 rare lipoprotein B [Legionella birminghamensis]STX31803.1 Rare lipoprotein B [Legionella birminghamensis]